MSEYFLFSCVYSIKLIGRRFEGTCTFCASVVGRPVDGPDKGTCDSKLLN
jgi:hypothetical protein